MALRKNRFVLRRNMTAASLQEYQRVKLSLRPGVAYHKKRLHLSQTINAGSLIALLILYSITSRRRPFVSPFRVVVFMEHGRTKEGGSNAAHSSSRSRVWEYQENHFFKSSGEEERKRKRKSVLWSVSSKSYFFPLGKCQLQEIWCNTLLVTDT